MTPIAVRDLASFIFRHGDLYPSGEGRNVEAWEGTAAHLAVQKHRASSDPYYRKEVALKQTIQVLGHDRQLQGRVDGMSQNETAQQVIEEYKTTRRVKPTLRGVDQAQAWLYAGMLCRQDPTIEAVATRVIYITPSGEVLATFEEVLSASQAQVFLALATACFATDLGRQQKRAARRETWARSLNFPHTSFRKNQRAVAGQVYKSVVSGQNLLLEAATGSGKTMAVLFPALKAQAIDEQFFFLTSRSRGADAAIAAAEQLIDQDSPLRVVQITAKEKTCPMQEMTCDAALCPNAAGYFDRLPAALNEMADIPLAQRQVIEDVAEAHGLCPFELSLDSALSADVIIGDYNYVFDPTVRLQRFAYDQHQSLLIDEAHQLSPRISAMLGVEICLSDIQRAAAEAPDSVQLVLTSMTHLLQTSGASIRVTDAKINRDQQIVFDQEATLLELLADFLSACDVAMGALAQVLEGERGDMKTRSLFDSSPQRIAVASQLTVPKNADNAKQMLPEGLLALYFIALRWQRSTQWTDAENYRHIITVSPPNPLDRGEQQQNIKINKYCINSGDYCAQVMAEHRAVVRFSGSVSPLDLYQTLHGQLSANDKAPEQSLALRAQSPFQAEQLGVFAVTDLDTFYRQRSRTLPELCQLLESLQRARPGRYLIAMPSYEYLQQLSECPEAPAQFMQQTRGMDERAQQDLLRQFQSTDEAVLGIVMGGVFGESIDLGSNPLSGVIVVSLGLPPSDLIKTETRRYFDETYGAGTGGQVAFLQPALSKIVQAAGRVIRGPEDRGILCLVDPRFADPNLANFFPEHWRLRITSKKHLEKELNSFWLNDLFAAAD